jgi:hypothetical protein
MTLEAMRAALGLAVDVPDPVSDAHAEADTNRSHNWGAQIPLSHLHAMWRKRHPQKDIKQEGCNLFDCAVCCVDVSEEPHR